MRAKFYTTTLDVAGIEPGPSAQRFPLSNASCASNVEFNKCWQFKNNIATQRNTYLLFRKVVSRKRGAFIEFDAEEKKSFLEPAPKTSTSELFAFISRASEIFASNSEKFDSVKKFQGL